MKSNIILSLFLVLIIYFIWKIFIYQESVYIRSTFDNNEYIIRGGKNKTENELLE